MSYELESCWTTEFTPDGLSRPLSFLLAFWLPLSSSHAPEFNDESAYRDVNRVKEEQMEKSIEKMDRHCHLRAERITGK